MLLLSGTNAIPSVIAALAWSFWTLYDALSFLKVFWDGCVDTVQEVVRAVV